MHGLFGVLAILSVLVPGLAAAQYPTKPVRFVVPLLAGGPADTAARIVGQSLSQAIGQPVVIENKPGADGVIATQAVLSSPADGYTLFFGGNSHLVGVPLMHTSPTFDPVTDFAPISFIGRYAFCLFVHPGIPAKSVAELIAYARANPDKLNYATSTLVEFMATVQLLKSGGISMVRVPYKGAAQAIPDLVAGRVQVDFAPLSAGLPHVKEGRLRVLATTLPRRSAAAPDVPTMVEAGVPGVTISPWAGIFGPAKTPKEIVDRLSHELNVVLRLPDVRAQFDKQGFQAEGSTPEALAAILREELRTWKEVIRQTGIPQD